MSTPRARRVLLTGASGLLGNTLAPALRRADRQIITHGFRREADVTFDLTNEAATHAELDRLQPDILINLVALTSVEQCQQAPDQAYRINVRTTEILARWVTRHPACFLVHISTDHVYDGRGEQREDDVRLTNVYAFSKYTSELAACHAGGIVLRTNFFGPSQLPGRASLSDWILENLRFEKPITLFNDIFFSPLSLATLTAMISTVVDRRIPGLFNLGSHAGLSKCDFGFALATAFQLPTTHVTIAASNFSIYRPKDMRMDVGLFENTFGVRLPTLGDEISALSAPRR